MDAPFDRSRAPAAACDKMTAKSPGDHSRMVMTQTIALAQDASRTFDAYLARPEHGKAPSIMIFTEMFGIGQHNRDMAEAYARRGFNALIRICSGAPLSRGSSPSQGRTATPPGRGS